MVLDSILLSVKKKLGILPDYHHFDDEIIMDINSAFFILNTLGIGPREPFTIEDESAVWTDFVTSGKIELVKSYIPLRVRLLFDPPTSSYLADSINKQISEFEFRMQVDCEKVHLPEPDMSYVYDDDYTEVYDDDDW